MKSYYVYILSNSSKTLYVGITNNLTRRVSEHKARLIPGFTRKYSINRLVYFEEFGEIAIALAREKEIKGWLRAKKIALINSMNLAWKDLSEEWGDQPGSDPSVAKNAPSG